MNRKTALASKMSTLAFYHKDSFFAGHNEVGDMHVRVHLQAIVAVSARRAEGVSVDHAYAHYSKCKQRAAIDSLLASHRT
jgi:hypothetical protein